MLRVLSTHLFLKHRLHPGLLELAERSGAQAVEIFAARQHFDYTSRESVAELAEWFRSNSLQPFSMHARAECAAPRQSPAHRRHGRDQARH